MERLSTVKFTKMHGAGNDFIVLNNCAGQLDLTHSFIKRLADRHFGIGADQILVVESSVHADFKYRIFNADGQEVQQCGNGARCFAQYVLDKRLTDKKRMTVETLAGIIQPELIAPNWVRVNMGHAQFEPAQVPFLTEGLVGQSTAGFTRYQLPVDSAAIPLGDLDAIWVGVVSMGNPHVVVLMDNPVSDAMVSGLGAFLESHPRFPERVNVGFLQVLNRNQVHLRVYERGVGETLACGTGACAAAVVGMKMGLIAQRVDVIKTGGVLTIEWAGQPDSDVLLTGPAQTVFEGEFYL